jgi:hypothetical protein
VVDLHVLPELLGAGHLALADPAGETGQRMGVGVAGVVERVAGLVLAVLAFQLPALQANNETFFRSAVKAKIGSMFVV